jgi:hypothetical protein
MAHEVTDKYAARDAFVARQLAELENDMAKWVEARGRTLRLTQGMRTAIDRTARRVFGRRRYLVLPGNSPVRQRFLKLMLTFAVAHEPRLLDRLGETARYLARNYPYEWSVSPVTRLTRQRARDLILANADSEFGETPLAAAVAYSRHHPREARVEHVASYGEVYTRALRLAQVGFFFDRHLERRQSLGLEAVGANEKALEEQERGPAPPA